MAVTVFQIDIDRHAAGMRAPTRQRQQHFRTRRRPVRIGFHDHRLRHACLRVHGAKAIGQDKTQGMIIGAAGRQHHNLGQIFMNPHRRVCPVYRFPECIVQRMRRIGINKVGFQADAGRIGDRLNIDKMGWVD